MTSTEEAARGGLPTELRQWARLIGTEPRGARELFDRAADEIDRLRAVVESPTDEDGGRLFEQVKSDAKTAWSLYRTEQARANAADALLDRIHEIVLSGTEAGDNGTVYTDPDKTLDDVWTALNVPARPVPPTEDWAWEHKSEGGTGSTNPAEVRPPQRFRRRVSPWLPVPTEEKNPTSAFSGGGSSYGKADYPEEQS